MHAQTIWVREGIAGTDRDLGNFEICLGAWGRGLEALLKTGGELLPNQATPGPPPPKIRRGAAPSRIDPAEGEGNSIAAEVTRMTTAFWETLKEEEAVARGAR